jgi:hypothetical protein
MSYRDLRELKKKIFKATIAVIAAEKYLEENPAYDNDIEVLGYNSKEYLNKMKAQKRDLQRELNRELELPMEADEIEENWLKSKFLDLANAACMPILLIDDILACSEVTWDREAYWKQNIDNCEAMLVYRDEQMGVP